MSLEVFDSVDKSSPVPVYYQVKKKIVEWVKNKDFKPGDLLIPEQKLAEMFGISRMTVRKAIDQLVEEGMLRRVQGKGTYISHLNKEKLQRDLSELNSLTDALEPTGKHITTELVSLDLMKADSRLAEKLGIEELDDVICFVRKRIIDEVPFFYETSYVPMKKCPQIISDNLKNSFFNIIEKKCNLQISDAIISLEAIMPDNDLAKKLKITKNQPVIKVEQVTYLIDGTAIHFVEGYSRGDSYKYFVHRKRKR